MDYRTNFIDLIAETVGLIPLEMTIKSQTAGVGNDKVLSVCDVKWAQAGYKVTIGGKVYKITDVDFAESKITVNGADPISATTFDLYPIKFFHGTPRETVTEVDKKGSVHANDATPMIWLNETFEYDAQDEFSAIDGEVTPDIFALGQCPKDKFSKDLKDLYLNPMARLMEWFIYTAKQQTQWFSMNEYETRLINYSKFGVYVNNRGVDSNIFSMPLSGVSNKGKILVEKQFSCNHRCS
jgi:hypothetical protein